MWGARIRKRKPEPEPTFLYLSGHLKSMNEQLDKPKAAEPRRINLRAFEYLSLRSDFYRLMNL